jgi:hypothetical protein
MRRKTIKLKRLLAITTILVLFFIVLLPYSVKYIITPKDKISFYIKESIALAGKSYFNQEQDRKVVYLDELIRKGYLSSKEYLIDNKCSLTLSTVSKVTINQTNKYVVELYCGSYFSDLTLSN